MSESLKISDIKYTYDNGSDGVKCFSFLLTGPNVTNEFSNAIVRTISTLVGSYAFAPNFITFDKNTSIFNCDYMRLRISNFPIPIEIEENNDESFHQTCVDLEQKRYESIYNKKSDLEVLEELKIKQTSLINNIHMHVDAKNVGDDILQVTSNSQYVTFYKNGKIIKDIFPNEILIVELHPKTEITFTAKADFNIPMENTMYSSTYLCHHNEIEKNRSFLISYYSYGQLSEKKIIIEACKILILKLELLRNKITNSLKRMKENTEESVSDINYKAELTIENDSHTIATVFTEALKRNEYVKSAGYQVEHPDDHHFVLKYFTEGMPITKIVDIVIKQLINDYKDLIKQIK